MKVRLDADYPMLIAAHLAARDDEINGFDPGAQWAKIFPGATEIEFVVRDDHELRPGLPILPPLQKHTGGER